MKPKDILKNQDFCRTKRSTHIANMSMSKHTPSRGSRLIALLGLIAACIFAYISLTASQVPATDLAKEWNNEVISAPNANASGSSDSGYESNASNYSVPHDLLLPRAPPDLDPDTTFRDCRCKGEALLKHVAAETGEPSEWTAYSTLVEYGWDPVIGQAQKVAEWLQPVLFVSEAKGGLGATLGDGHQVEWINDQNSVAMYKDPDGNEQMYKVCSSQYDCRVQPLTLPHSHPTADTRRSTTQMVVLSLY